MGFSQDTIKKAWQSADGRCECRRISHNHPYIRCNKALVWENRELEDAPGAWELHHITDVRNGGSDSLSNSEVLCWDCLTKTLS
ncbi:MAG: HNH endonuclease signature motif containing protein [Acidobacteriota bacterium]|nr:HNH endonuclease signature motif containing protein [Acidobacteriota bacterium]